jgi:hypothetical protein
MLARGYINKPMQTAASFMPDPFSLTPGARMYKTGMLRHPLFSSLSSPLTRPPPGDLVRFLPDGNIVFLQRIDGQVKIRGFRVEVGEVEQALGSLPQVGKCVVTVRTDAHNRKTVHASLFLKKIIGFSVQSLMLAFAAGGLCDSRESGLSAQYLCAAGDASDAATRIHGAVAVHGAGCLPYDPERQDRSPQSAHAERSARPRILLLSLCVFLLTSVRSDEAESGSCSPILGSSTPSGTATPVGAATPASGDIPRSGSEVLVAGAWRDLLGVQDVGTLTNFFDVGGHSLAVMQLSARLRKATGASVPAATIFRSPSLGAIAAALDAEIASRQRSAAGIVESRFSLQPAVNYPLSHSQRSLWFIAKLTTDPLLAAAYNVVLPLRFNSPVNFGTLRRSLQARSCAFLSWFLTCFSFFFSDSD